VVVRYCPSGTGQSKGADDVAGDYILISDYEDINIDFSFNVVHFPNHDNIFILK
jgi:hypothetical protein